MTQTRGTKRTAVSHEWQFRARFRRHAFGWKSQPAVQRVKEAVSEIKRVARTDATLAAEGAVLFLERVSPALEHVDSSSGSIGTAVRNAIASLVSIIGAASVSAATRAAWLERLWAAHEADAMPYIESLTDYWGELCASKDLACEWADRLIPLTRHALSPEVRAHFHGTSACVSALFYAERYDEVVNILEHADTLWQYRRWAVRALAAMSRTDEAIEFAESCRGPWTSDGDVDAICEGILLSSGRIDEAYRRYAATANRGSTYVATFREVVRKYPHKPAPEILADLVASTPGEEGKWFAAAKSAGLLDEALELARRSPCDPKSLTRAARDFAQEKPAFAVAAGLLALHWLVQGHGYEITGADVWGAYLSTMKAAEQGGSVDDTRQRARAIVEGEGIRSHFVRQLLGHRLGLE